MDDGVNHDSALLDDLKSLIEGGRRRAAAAVNSALTITYWHVGRRINENILNGERAKYGRRIVASLAEQLVGEYGSSFGARNLRRMMRFAEIFPDSEIVTPLVSQLSWTHFIILMKLPSDESRSFYIHRTLENRWITFSLRNTGRTCLPKSCWRRSCTMPLSKFVSGWRNAGSSTVHERSIARTADRESVNRLKFDAALPIGSVTLPVGFVSRFHGLAVNRIPGQ